MLAFIFDLNLITFLINILNIVRQGGNERFGGGGSA